MDRDYEFLLLAFEEAEIAKTKGTFPIGAVLVNSDGSVIGKGHNKVFSDCDFTAHAEVDLIRKASDKLLDIESKRFIKNDYTLYSTCEHVQCVQVLYCFQILRESYGRQTMKAPVL